MLLANGRCGANCLCLCVCVCVCVHVCVCANESGCCCRLGTNSYSDIWISSIELVMVLGYD